MRDEPLDGEPAVGDRLGQGGVGDRVEVRRVRPELVGGAGEGARDPGAELVLEHRQHRRPHPDPWNRGSLLCGSVQNSMPSAPAGRLGVRAGHVEQRAAEHARTPRRMPARERPPEPRVSPSSTVSAWSSSVCPSSTCVGSEPGGELGRARRTAPAGRPPPGRPPRPSTETVAVTVSSTPSARHLVGDPRGVLGRAVLEPVVDGHTDHAHGQRPRPRRRWRRAAPASRRRRSRRRGPCCRGRARRAPPYGEPDGRDRRVRAPSEPAQPWTRATHGSGVGISALRRQVAPARPRPR